MDKFRAYFLCNQYLSSIQQGIQAQHCTAELFLKYTKSSAEGKMLYHWAEFDRTTIVLNGGFSSHLESFYERLSSLPIPVAKFHEGKEELNSALTCVGFIFPHANRELEKWQEIYDTFRHLRLAR